MDTVCCIESDAYKIAKSPIKSSTICFNSSLFFSAPPAFSLTNSLTVSARICRVSGGNHYLREGERGEKIPGSRLSSSGRPGGVAGLAGCWMTRAGRQARQEKPGRLVSRSGCALFASAGFVGCYRVVKAHGGDVESLGRGRGAANPHFNNTVKVRRSPGGKPAASNHLPETRTLGTMP